MYKLKISYENVWEKRGEREKKIIKRKKYFSQVRDLEFSRYARVILKQKSPNQFDLVKIYTIFYMFFCNLQTNFKNFLL